LRSSPPRTPFLLPFFFLTIRPPPTSTLFPYTTLFRSVFARKPKLLGNDCRIFSHTDDVESSNVISHFRRSGQRRNRLPLRRHERSEEHTSELQSRENLVCRLLLEKKKQNTDTAPDKTH